MKFLKNLMIYSKLEDIQYLDFGPRIQWTIIIFLKKWLDAFIFAAGFTYLILYNPFLPFVISKTNFADDFNTISFMTTIVVTITFIVDYVLLKQTNKGILSSKTQAELLKNNIRKYLTEFQKENPQEAQKISEALNAIEDYQHQSEIAHERSEGEITMPVLIEYLNQKSFIKIKFQVDPELSDYEVATYILNDVFDELVITVTTSIEKNAQKKPED